MPRFGRRQTIGGGGLRPLPPLYPGSQFPTPIYPYYQGTPDPGMEHPVQPSVMTPQAPVEPPRGGLSEEPQGGLARFLGNVQKGIELVTTNPIYQRLWAGAVSGQANDPMAGPAALAQMRPPPPSLSDHLTQLRIRQTEQSMLQDANKRRLEDEMGRAFAAGDYARAGEIYAQLNPGKAYERKMAPQTAPQTRRINLPNGLVQAQEWDATAGRYVDVGPPGRMSPLAEVNIGGNKGPEWGPFSGLVDRYQKEAAQYLASIEAIPRMRALAAEDNAAADMQLIYAVAKARDPGSVVREGEVDFAKASGSKVEELAQAAKEWTKSGKLSPVMRDRLIGAMATDLRAQLPAERARRERYRKFAEQYAVPYDLMFPPSDSIEAQLERAGVSEVAGNRRVLSKEEAEAEGLE